MATQTQSILRNSLTASSSIKNGPMRSILRRPEPLALSPRSSAFTQLASFSVKLSPSISQAIKSPHVHFPPSPSQLISTFTALSSGSYDRAPISISPNPLTIPGWGERVYSPSVEGFRLQAAPKTFRTLAYQGSPIITDFEDPRSPKLPAAKVSNKTAANTIRFASFVNTRERTRQSQTLEKAMSSYPRSPYPSAPISPSESRAPESPIGAEDEMDMRGRQLSRTGEIPSAPARARARAQSVQERRRSKKNLTLAPRFNMSVANSPSPLGRSIFSPAVSSLNRPHKPAPLAMDSLTQEFWQAVSLEPSASETTADLDEPMVTALEYPESAVEYEEKLDMTLCSARQPPVMYAAADGALWSPGLPTPGAAMQKIRETLMSPGVGKSFGRASTIVRKDFTAPSPNDPFAAFPSFGTALGGGGLQYPPRVVRA
ncbi:hypothetical protein HYPSUDRAFT_197262 [Hypholoma sublateritium FD-334 SS-4]|uniref:Uncharacterized protein n=1 Tax=Hypholoma sublateritium (strain FD-334 SS-4) TaxID=945553 RepID=A0A0D2PIU4_HYPSF|nr:hypothetical protein HYPSUDRAFT_197262 [Hypholoma sublateritium FD-334 SS-4]